MPASSGAGGSLRETGCFEAKDRVVGPSAEVGERVCGTAIPVFIAFTDLRRLDSAGSVGEPAAPCARLA